jgi:hypothetical protein
MGLDGVREPGPLLPGSGACEVSVAELESEAGQPGQDDSDDDPLGQAEQALIAEGGDQQMPGCPLR